MMHHKDNPMDVEQKEKKYSATGNRTPVSRVTGGDTHHYTIVELISIPFLTHLQFRKKMKTIFTLYSKRLLELISLHEFLKLRTDERSLTK